MDRSTNSLDNEGALLDEALAKKLRELEQLNNDLNGTISDLDVKLNRVLKK